MAPMDQNRFNGAKMAPMDQNRFNGTNLVPMNRIRPNNTNPIQGTHMKSHTQRFNHINHLPKRDFMRFMESCCTRIISSLASITLSLAFTTSSLALTISTLDSFKSLM